MKILTGIDINFNPFGGSPLICDDWYSELEKEHEILFLTMPPSTKKQWWKMKNVHFLKTKKIKDVNKYPEYVKKLGKEVSAIVSDFNPEIIHIQHINFGLSRSFVDLNFNIPKIGICHGTDTQIARDNDYFKSNLIHIADKTDHLVFPTENMAADFFEIYHKRKNYSIIHHGLPKELFVKHNINKVDHKLKLLYAGRLNHYKGVDIAVSALSQVKYLIHLDIIGDEDEKNYIQKIKNIIKEHNLDNKITLHKSIPRHKLWEKFSEYDGIVIPSRSLEAFSLTAIEAQARGLPVIYGNGGGIVNAVGDSGIMIKDNQPETLAKIIIDIIENPKILKKLRKRGYKNSKKYTIEKQINKLINIGNIISRKKKNMSEVSKKPTDHFGMLWEREVVKLDSGNIEPAIMSDGRTVPVNFCISTVSRLEKQSGGNSLIKTIYKELAGDLEKLDGQFIYPPQSMHISLIGCTQREDSIKVFTDDQIQRIKNTCEGVFSGGKAISVEFIGMGLIGNQVFFQGYPKTRGWEVYREKLENALYRVGENPITYPNKSPIHMNFLRITDTSPDFLNHIANLVKNHRETNFGKVRFSIIDLVTTDFVLSEGNIDLIKEFNLQ